MSDVEHGGLIESIEIHEDRRTHSTQFTVTVRIFARNRDDAIGCAATGLARLVLKPMQSESGQEDR